MGAVLLAALAQLSIAVSAPDSVAHDDTLVLTVRVTSATLVAPSVTVPVMDGFALRRTEASSLVEGDDMNRHVVLDIRYHMVAHTPGQYTIPSFTARLGNRTTASVPRRVVVTGVIEPPQRTPTIVNRATIDSTRPVSVAAIGTPDTVYVGQQATYQVAVFIDEAVLRQRSPRNPTFTPPDLRGTLSYEMPATRAVVPSRVAGQRRFRPHIYQRAIFPLVPGTHVVPAATLDYNLPTSGSFFSRDETHTLRADAVAIIALPLPDEGKPPGFNGAVGRLSVEQGVTNLRPRVGDPFVVRARVRGDGNVKLFPRPLIEIEWADVIPAGERVTTEVSDGRVGGVKEFEWVVTPRESGIQQLPAIRYPYFDPVRRRYSIAESGVESLDVRPGALVAASETTFNAPPALQIRRRYSGREPLPLHRNPFFILIAIAAPLPALAGVLRRTRVPAIRSHRKSRAAPLLARNIGNDAADLRRALVAFLEQRLRLRPGAVATAEGLRRAMLRNGVSRETALEAQGLLGELDARVFGAQQAGSAVTAARVEACLARVDAEAVRNPVTFGSAVLFLFVAAVAVTEPNPEAAAAFDRGVSLYDLGAYTDAANEFFSTVSVEPRSADGWTNLASAAWQAGDTASAVLSWERAIRLEPFARDIRQNRHQALAAASPIPIPATPLDAMSVAALLAWIGCWFLAFQRARGGLRILAAPPVVLLAVATVLGLHIAQVSASLADPRVAVVREPVMSRVLPALGADEQARLSTGELVLRTARDGEWSLVKLHGSTAGWVHDSHLVSVLID